VILLDTNVVSEVTRKEPNLDVLDWLEANKFQLHLPAVSIGEMSYGIERIRPAERSSDLSKAFTRILERFSTRYLAFDEIDALHYGKLMGESERGGRTMSVADGMLAALATRHEARLATRNIAHFEHLEIVLINPWTD
jgi:predicted nucleic acid-binding protein